MDKTMPRETDKYSNSVSLFDEPGGRNRRTAEYGGRNSGGQGGGRNYPPKRRKKFPALLIDVLVAAFILLVFYLTNYTVHSETSGSQLPNQAAAAATETPVPADNAATDGTDQTNDAAATESPPAAQATPQPADPAAQVSWREKFADKFTSGTPEQTATTYKDANVNVSIEKVQQNNVTYFFADIYIADVQYFKTAFAKQPNVMGGRELTNVVAKENNAILAINGDHCVDNNGPVIRNGQLFRDEKFADALVMNYDGSMQTFSADQLDMNAIKTNGAWQVWTFGPMLLKDGQPMTEFNSTLLKANPRTAVGYYEPGHYCFLVVDGRQAGYSDGMTMQELSQFFYDKGCKVAFNMDGGQSSEMAFMGNVVNQPYNGGRSTTDILYIGE